MSWVKLDDQLPRHPKIISVSVPARWAYIEGLCYVAQYLTDGAIPAGQVKAIASPKIVRELTDVGLWHMTLTGVSIHDYLDYNPSGADVAKHRRELSKTRSKAGSKGAASRWQKAG